MAKKDLIDNSNVENEKGIVVYSLEDLMGERFRRYAKYIIQDRALPDVRDGLKPVQRRILYAMNDLNLTHDKAYKKSARVVGEVIGKYHPHGDTSIYDAMVRMSQWWKLNMPLIDMQGNNGSIDGDSAAAMRYTETRLEKISKLLLDDLEKETVTFIPNFDDSEKEPAVLPSYFPNILTNGSVGIAAGYSTNIPPHNLAELIDATIRLIKNPNTRLDTILELVHGPDFPTGGTVQGREGIIDAFKTGRGKVILSAKWHEEKGNIVIDEIPYEVVKQDLIIKIGDVIDANQGLGIKEVRDETDRNGIRVVIELSDKANFETVRKFLFKNTPLSVSYNYNNVVIVDKQPRLLGIIEILNAYIAHYKEIFTKKTVFDLNKSKKRLEIVSGLIKAMSILDQVIELIRKSENKQNAIENLVNKFAFTTQQATAIVEMRLYRLTSTDVVKLNQEKTDLDSQIKIFESILNDESILNTTIIDRLKQVKKDFGIPRRSEVNEIIENLSVEHKDVIVEKRFTLWISRDGYLKGIDNIVLAKNEPETFARKANDIWINKTEVSNLEHLLLITNKGTYFSFPLYKLPMSKWKENGVHINTIATMEPEELIVASFVVPNFDQATQQIMLCTKNGAIKRTPIIDFETKIFTKSFRIMKLIDNDEVVSADLITSKTNSCVIVTKQGFAVQYHLEDVPVQGTNSKGVKAANIKESDEIIAARALENEQSIAILTERGGIKKVDREKIPLFIRPKRGSRILPERKRGTEYITHAFAIQPDDIIKLIQDDDSYYDVPVSKYRRIEMESPANELGITNFTDASLEKNYEVINGDYPISSNNVGDEGSAYVSRAEMRAKVEANKGKVSSKVVVTKQLKAEAQAKVENIKGSDLSDLLGDISSLMQNFNTPKEVKKESKKAKDKEENIQLDFDDLFD